MKSLKLIQYTVAVAGLFVHLGTVNAENIVVFGDSLSDTGNIASVSEGGTLPPPFFEGSRISNGPVAVEIAAELAGDTLLPSLHLVGGNGGLNYAVAGARAAGEAPIDLPTQVGAFLLSQGGIAPADKTYIMFIGGNDVRDARDAPLQEAYGIIRTATNGVEEQLNLLVNAGAQSIMVVTTPDIGKIPETLEQATDRQGRRLQFRASWLTHLFNLRVERAVKEIEQNNGLDLVILDINDIFDNITGDAAARGFSNTTEACLNTTTFEFNEGCGFGANFDQFVFFDQIHPSARTHEIAGRVIYAYLPTQL